ncbi:unnamed protein product [Nesidiocoris tenuis]|uniref:Uncharacterized protein n=1 Tax=Nesidiocoris tenuis TaxID=355587 RepID=A0A6H5HMI5_9HEMI|nr:unnamed protein product [Nesidiocoris tenuis]
MVSPTDQSYFHGTDSNSCMLIPVLKLIFTLKLKLELKVNLKLKAQKKEGDETPFRISRSLISLSGAIFLFFLPAVQHSHGSLSAGIVRLCPPGRVDLGGGDHTWTAKMEELWEEKSPPEG